MSVFVPILSKRCSKCFVVRLFGKLFDLISLEASITIEHPPGSWAKSQAVDNGRARGSNNPNHLREYNGPSMRNMPLFTK